MSARAPAPARQPLPGDPDRSGPVAGLADPRAVRVATGPTTHLDGDPIVVVGPLPEPVIRGLPVVTGEGLLGGIVSGDGPGPHPAGTADPPAMLLIDGEPRSARVSGSDGRHATLDLDGRSIRLILGPIERRDHDGITAREVVVDGWRIDVELEPEARASLRERARRSRKEGAAGGPVEVHAIIPGRIVAVSVTAGDTVSAGQQLLVLEAMKMQNELRAPREGTIDRVGVAVGTDVEVGDLLLVIR